MLALRLAFLALVIIGVGRVAHAQDCNLNGVPDATDIALGTSDDCQPDGIPDECNIATGTPDCNLNGIPDGCEPALPFVPSPAGGFASVSSVAVSGDFAVVGSTADSSAATSAGAVHVFRRVGTIWIADGPELVASDAAANDLLGASVSIDGGLLAVGAPGADIGGAVDAGAVYVFRRVAGTWVEEDKLTLAVPTAEDELGSAVSARGDRILAGAPMTGAASATGQGAIFSFDGLAWSQEASLVPGGLASGDRFGTAVHLAPSTAFVGAPGRQVVSTAAAGMVYVYTLAGTWSLTTTLVDTTPQTGALFGRALAGTDDSVAIGAPDQDALAGAVHVFERSGAVWGASQELASPAVPASERFGVAIGMSDEFLIVGESETTATTVGMAHVYDRGTATWTFDATLVQGVLGDLYGDDVATDGRYGIVSASGVPRATIHWIQPIPDCNTNGIDDACEIAALQVPDCDLNGVPDGCEGLIDATAPVITGVPSNIGVSTTPGLCSAVVSWTPPNATDNCLLRSFTSNRQSGQTFALGNTTVTYTAIDTSGNTTTASFTVSVSDSQVPFFTNVPFNISTTAAAGVCGANVTWTVPTANDNCAVFNFGGSHVPGAFFPVGTTTVTYTATDIVGNVGVASFTVTVSDLQLPTITGLPANIVASASPTACNAVVSWTAPTASDNCAIATFTSNFAPGATFPAGVTTVTYTATDVNGNVTPASFTVTVNDTTPPSLAAFPGNITVPANAGLCTAAVSWTAPTATDNCTVASLVSTHPPGATFPIGATTVTYTATDGAGNVTSQGFTVTVLDIVPPVISGMPANITVPNGNGTCGALVTWTPPTATDLCSVASLGSNFLPGAVFPVGVTTVTYTATDGAGNTAQASFLVTVNDTQLPVISGMPANIALSAAAGTCARVATWTAPTANDNCAVASFAPNFTSGTSFPVGVTTVTYTATDLAGNQTTASFTVTITDTQLPSIVGVPANISVQTAPGTCAATVAWGAPTATDNCSVASFTPNFPPGSSFPVGTTTVIYTAIDPSGNTQTASFTVTVADAELPVISGVPASISVSNAPGTCAATVTWTSPTAADNCSVVSLTPSAPSGSSFPVGVTTVTYTALDPSGNAGLASFTVTVSDTQVPSIAGAPTNITIPAAPGLCSAVATWTAPTATDNCTLASFTANFPSGASFPVGSTSVTYTATDLAGNTSTASFTVTVQDLQVPSIAGNPGPISVSTPAGSCSATVTWVEPTATDNCAVANFTTSHPSGATFPLGTTTVTYTAVDSAGNSSTASFAVTVNDTVNPVISGVPADILASAAPGTCAALITWTAPTATDNCTLSGLVADILPGTSFPVGTTTVTYTATDAAGNSALATFDVVVTDDEDPVIIGTPANISVTTPAGQSTAVVTWIEPSAADNCTVASLTPDIPSGSTFSVGVTQVTYTALDVAGNTSSTSFNVTVTDNEAPVISGVPADIVQNAAPGTCSAVVTWTPPTATDNTVVVSFAPNIPPGSTFPVGTTVVTYTATDDSGNSSSASFDVIVVDNQLPVIAGTPSNITLPATFGFCSRVVTWTAPTATDNCSVASLTPNFPSGTAFPVGATTVTYSAIDASGNTATSSFTVTIQDLQNPTLTAVPANISLSAAPGTCARAATWTPPNAADNCSVASLTSSAPSGSSFPVGATTVTYTATDASGNTASASFTVTVTDNEQPIITGTPANISLSAAPGTCSAVAVWTAPTATDNCTLQSFTGTATSGSSFPVGVTPVTYVATDAAGNSRVATFVVSVLDTQNPVITGLPGNITTNAAPGTCAATVLWATPSASDNCAIASFGSNIASGASFPVGVTPVTYVATDTGGRATTATFLVTVVDNQAPTISGLPANITIAASPGLCSRVVTWVEPTASDTCSPTTLSTNRPSGSTFAVGTTTVTYTANDGANVSIATFTVTVQDLQAPVITGLPLSFNVASIPGGCGATVNWSQPSATDNCALASLTSSHVSGATFPVGSTTVTYTATDVAGNAGTASFSFTVTDDEDPTIAGTPANIVVSTTGSLCTAPATWTAPTATDNCGTPVLTSNFAPGASFPLGVTPVVYTATDTGGNTRTASFTVTVLDGAPPTLSGVPANISVTNTAGLCGAVVTWTQPTATDSCSATSLSSSIPSGSTFPLGTTTVTYTASDGVNSTVASFTVTVTDGQAPSITNIPANITVPAAPGTCAATAVWIAPIASDNCSLASLVPNFPSGASFSLGTTTVTYTATDTAGNASTASFQITVTDTQSPVLTNVPAPVTVLTSGGLCTAIASWTPPTATDNCGPSTLTSNFAPGTTFPVGIHTVTYTATDPSGNSGSANFSVTVVDGGAPVISNVPANITVGSSNGSCGAVVSWTSPTATDACASATVTANIPSGSFFPVGTTTVIFTATDGGNSSTASFTVTVNDVLAPSITSVPSAITVPAAPGACSATATWTAPTASDNCAVASLLPNFTSGSTFPLGVTTVTYTATDAAGNSSTASFTVSVTDTQPPTWSGVPSNIAVSTTGGQCSATATWTPPSAADNCGAPSVIASATPGSVFPVGINTVTYTATDAAGNATPATFTVTVADGGAPVISGMPANVITTSSPGLCSRTVTWTAPTATDACGTATLSSSHPIGSSFPVGTTTVTYTATDGANSSTATFTVTVNDAQNPVVTGLPAPITLLALAGSCAAPAVWVVPTATDNCTVASLVPNFSPGSTFPVGTTTVTYTATDVSGNTGTGSFTVTVVDSQDPVISGMPSNLVATAAPGVGSAVVSWTAPTATDNCTLASLVPSFPPGSTFPIGVTTVTYTATDAAGNTATASFTVTVSDNQSPVINGTPANITVSNTPNLCSALVSWTAPTATDNGTLVSFTSNHAPGSSFPVGTTPVTYTAVDDSANVTTATFSVTVTDGQNPNFTGVPAAINVPAGLGTCAASATWTPPAATDNCTLSSVVSNALPGASFPVGTTTVTYTATDLAGNATTVSFAVTVLDSQLPVITGMPANIAVSTTGGLCTAAASWAAPAAFDNCGIQSLTASHASGSAFPVGVTTVTYTATDVNGNVRNSTFTVTVADGNAPVISGVPANILTTTSPAICGAVVTWTAPSAVDACGTATLSSNFPSGATFPVGTTQVTYTATDGSNSSSASFQVTVTDGQSPVITGVPSNLVVPAQTGLCAATVSWVLPTTSDNCAVASLTSNRAPGSVFAVGTTAVNYLATDTSGNSATVSFTVTVVDTQRPSLVGIPSNILLTTAGGLCTAVANWSPPTATDNCTLASLTSNFPPGAAFPVGVTTVTYTALDIAGNTTTGNFTVSVSDSQAPVITSMPANISLPAATGTCARTVTWTAPTAADACGAASLSSSHAPGASFPVGTTTVTYTASDGVNSSQASFTVTITDAQSPTIVGLPANLAIPAAAGGCSAVVSWTPPTATDNCSGATVVPNLPPGSTFPLGNTPVSYIATDGAGNSSFGTFIVTVFDAQPPTINGTPANITVTAATGTCSRNVSWIPPTASDLCGSAGLSSSFPSGANFPAGTTTVNYTATDLAGNSATTSFTVTVLDTSPPVLIGVPGSQVLPVAAGTCSRAAFWSDPVAIDPCGAVVLSSNYPAGTAFPLGTTLVTYTATDLSGNVATGSFGITVVDNTGPSVTGTPADIFVSVAPGSCNRAVTWVEPVFTDGCGIANFTRSHVPGAVFPLGTTIVVYTASDPSGNLTVVNFDVTVSDFQGPTFTGMPSDILIPNTTGQCSATVTWTPPTASDPCGVASLSSNFQPGAVLAAGVTTVTYTAVDNNGNVSTASFTITIQDQIAPVLVNVPANMVVPVAPGFCGTVPTWTPPLPVDNCGILSLTSSVLPGAFFPLGTTTVTYTATDLNNNTVSASFTITVEDVLPPVFGGVPNDIVLTLAPGSCSQVVTWTPPTAGDPCGLATLVGSHAPGVTLGAGITVVTYTATDVNGNVATASFDIEIIDPQSPAIAGLPGNIAVGTSPGLCSATVTWTAPTASDNCAIVTFTSTHAPASSFPVGVTTVTYTATDPSGNSTSGSFTVTVTDNQLPTIPNLPAAVSVNTANNQCQAVVNWALPVGADNCGVATIVGSHAPQTTFPVGTTLVTYTITDIHGNVANYTFPVNVVDDDDPTISGLPLVLNVQSGAGLCGATVNWPNPITADNCGVVSITSTHTSGSFFPIGTTVVTYTATDASGNQGFRNLTITVVDNQLPVISGLPANLSVSNTPGLCLATVSWTPPTASDNCGVQSFTSTHAPGSLFPIGQTPVTYTATDVNGGVRQLTFTVTVSDTELPFLQIGGNITVPALPGDCSATVAVPIPTASDNCNLISVTNSQNGTGDASGLYPYGVTAVTWTAIDEHGNVTTAVQSITVTVPLGNDCNQNGIPDICDLEQGTSADCDGNGILDVCDIAADPDLDANGDGVIDSCESTFRRGDINDDGGLNIADAIYLLMALFVGGSPPNCMDAADTNDDGFIDISDVIFEINYIFVGGAPPASPFPGCGLDPTGADPFGCENFNHCP